MHLFDIYDYITEKNEYLFIRFDHACEVKFFLTTKIIEYRFSWEECGLKRTENGGWRGANALDGDEEIFSKKGDVAAIVGLQFVYHPNYLGALVIDVPQGKRVRRQYLPWEDFYSTPLCERCELPFFQFVEKADLTENEAETLKTAKRYDFNGRIFVSNTDQSLADLCSVTAESEF